MARYTLPTRKAPRKASRASCLLLGFTLLTWLLLLPLVVNVAGRIEALSRVRAEIQRMQDQLERDAARVDNLRAALDYARSESFVEYWARTQQRWSRADEVVVVVPDGRRPAYLWWESFLEQPRPSQPNN